MLPLCKGVALSYTGGWPGPGRIVPRSPRMGALVDPDPPGGSRTARAVPGGLRRAVRRSATLCGARSRALCRAAGRAAQRTIRPHRRLCGARRRARGGLRSGLWGRPPGTLRRAALVRSEEEGGREVEVGELR